tara:strand:+ start:208 stop:669 length:462 start_codon:yes stop_codon:yes gene_type:complete
MSPARQKQVIAVVALCVVAGVLAFISLSDIEDNLVYYWDPAQLLEKGELAKKATIRLGGVVRTDSIDWNPETLKLHFKVGMTPNEKEEVITVHSVGAPPQMFQEGMGVVVEGQYDGQIFKSERVMVKHSNEYRAPKEGERPQEIYKTLLQNET